MTTAGQDPPSAPRDDLAHIAMLLAGEQPSELREGLLVDFSLVASLSLIRAVARMHPAGDGFVEEMIQQWRARVELRMGHAFVLARKSDPRLLNQALVDQAQRGFVDELDGVEQILRTALLSHHDPDGTASSGS